jgi:hypothetical protein
MLLSHISGRWFFHETVALTTMIVLCFGLSANLSRGTSGTRVRGVISDVIGGRIQNASLELLSTTQVLRTTSDAAGEFEFVGLSPATYALRASSRGFKLKTIEDIRVTGKDMDPVSITLEVAADGDCSVKSWTAYEASTADSQAVVGSILLVPEISLPNRALEKARIDLLAGDDSRVVRSEHLNKYGHFQFRNLEPGIYFVQAFYSGFNESKSMKFYVTCRDRTKIILSMFKSGQTFACE